MKAPNFTALTRIHRERRLDLQEEVQELEARYDKLKAQEERLLSYRNRLNSIRRERNGASEWTLEERSFIEKIAGKATRRFNDPCNIYFSSSAPSP